MESHTARDALDLVADARAAAADRLVTPWWYHPALGLLGAQLIFGYAVGGTAVKLACLAMYLLGIAALVRAYRSLTGMWISGLRPGRARRSAIAIGVLFAVCMIAAIIGADVADHWWPAAVVAAVGLAGTIVLGRRFDDRLRAELRAGR
jgi:hypothetical protein